MRFFLGYVVRGLWRRTDLGDLFIGRIEDLRLDVVTLLRIANDKRAPQWRPGDEFEAARKAAIQALTP